MYTCAVFLWHLLWLSQKARMTMFLKNENVQSQDVNASIVVVFEISLLFFFKYFRLMLYFAPTHVSSTVVVGHFDIVAVVNANVQKFTMHTSVMQNMCSWLLHQKQFGCLNGGSLRILFTLGSFQIGTQEIGNIGRFLEGSID